MLYIANSPLSLVSYHAAQQTKKTPSIYQGVEPCNLCDLLIQGTPLTPVLQVIEPKYSDPPKELYQSQFNTTYLVADTSLWESLAQIKDWIQIIQVKPELYRKPIEQMRSLFEPDAFDWMWNQFKFTPFKLEMELTILLFQVQATRQQITLKDLFLRYDSVLDTDFSRSIHHYFGTPKGTEILRQASVSNLWGLLIGSENKAPFIYHYLVTHDGGANPDLYSVLTLIQSAVQKGFDIRIAAVLFNQWLIENGAKQERNKLKFSATSQQIQKLEELFH